MTEKGRGYSPAEQDVADRFHAVGQIHPETGLPLAPSRFGWTSVFADEMVRIGRRRTDVVAITAAMLAPVGLAPFAAEFPARTFDVGIAEQHAATSAAGMAYAGLHPVVAVYATFLNRAFDQVLMDVALHRAGVTFVLDRAGHHRRRRREPQRHVGHGHAVGRPGPAAGGAAGRGDAARGAAGRRRHRRRPDRRALPQGRARRPDPCAGVRGRRRRLARLGEGPVPPATARPSSWSSASARWSRPRSRPPSCSPRTACASPSSTPRWVLPVPSALVKLAGEHDHVVTLEDGLVDGGVGAMLAQRAREAGVVDPGAVDRHPARLPRPRLARPDRRRAAAAPAGRRPRRAHGPPGRLRLTRGRSRRCSPWRARPRGLGTGVRVAVDEEPSRRVPPREGGARWRSSGDAEPDVGSGGRRGGRCSSWCWRARAGSGAGRGRRPVGGRGAHGVLLGDSSRPRSRRAPRSRSPSRRGTPRARS